MTLRFYEVQSQSYTGILAGGNGCGFSGDGGPATSAKMNSPRGVWSDSMGNVYISEGTGNRVRVVNSVGIISTIVGTGSTSTSGAGGPGLSTSLDYAWFLVGDTGSNLYIAGHYFTWRYSLSTLQVTRVIGSSANVSYTGDGGPATSATMNVARGIAISTSGNLYAADWANCIIRAVNKTTNIITTSVGTPPTCGFSGDGGLATSAKLYNPSGIWLSSNNDLYIADTYNYRIRRVSNNIITTIAGTGSNALGGNTIPATSSPLNLPAAVAGDSLGNIYITEYISCRVRIVQSGIITTILGTGSCANGGSTYQSASSAPITTPWQIWVNSINTLYVAEIDSCVVRYVNVTFPSLSPTAIPTRVPTTSPTVVPSKVPTGQPTTQPSTLPTSQPSNQPTTRPSTLPTSQPSNQPTTRPSTLPTSQPSNQPTTRPSSNLTLSPSVLIPTFSPTFSPSYFILSCLMNASSWKEVSFLFGSFSFDYVSSTLLDTSSYLNSPSSIIFGSKSLSSSALTVNVSYSSMSCQYPVAHISSSYKRDTTSRAAVVPGDVNGDAYNDLIVCSPLTSVCNIYFGKEEDGLRNVMIGVTIYGPSSSSTASSSSQPAATFFGFAVAGAEDMNEDGLADVLVSSLTGRAVYVIYGRRSWSSVFRVSEMRSGEDGYKIVADSSTTLTGISVSGVGDMNGDGRKDVALSVQRGGLFMVYVIWGEGGVGGSDVLLDEVVGGLKGFSVTGEQGYYTGLSISGLGDVNDDGLDDLLIGAIPYPDRAKNPPQKSYVILGSSAGLSDIVLGGSVVGVVNIVGGGFMVSGPGDVNDDGIDDIMITNVRDYVGKGNAYIISYPSRMTSSPSLIPSSFPSSSPSQDPSSEPSSSFPSSSPSSSYPSTNITSPSSLPNQTTTLKPSRSSRPTTIPTSRRPSIAPTMTAVPSLRQTTRNPSMRPSSISTSAKSIAPSRSPSQSRSPSIIPTLAASLNPSPLPYLVRVVNSTSGIVYGVEGANERFEISSMSNDGMRRSGWSGTIIGGRGRKIYVIYPKDPLQPVNRIILEDFDKTSDVLDLSHISQIASKADLTYLTNPLTIFLPDNQKIVLSSYDTMNDLTDEDFVFRSSVTSSSSEVSLKDLNVVIPLFGSMIVLLMWMSNFSVCNKDDENKGVQKTETERDENLTEDMQPDQEMNAIREEMIDTKEELRRAANSIISHNSHSEDLDDISSWGIEDLLSKDSLIEYDEESLLSLAINNLNHSNIHDKENEDEEQDENQDDSFLDSSESKEEL